MSAEIIPFPGKLKYKEEETECNEFYTQTEEGIVVESKFPKDWPYHICGVPVNPPKDGFEYLELCKQFLEPEDYTDLLVAIMDKDAYDGIEERFQKLVDNYYSFFAK